MVDLDEMFAYSTYKVVRIVDRYLGLAHYLLQLLIVLYIGIYVLYIDGKYLAHEYSTGEVSIKTKGLNWATTSLEPETTSIWDAYDAIEPSVERGAIFIATSVTTTFNQTIGTCNDLEATCTKNEDCGQLTPVNTGICSVEGYCIVNGWCPYEDPDDTSISVVHHLESEEAYTMWVQSSIRFNQIDDTFFSTINEKTPIPWSRENKSGNLLTLGDFLDLADIHYEEIRDTGFIMSVSIDWECPLPSDTCTPSFSATALQSPEQNYNFRKSVPRYDLTTGLVVRDLYKYTGVRIFFKSEGHATKFSFAELTLQLAAGLGLLGVARVIADMLLYYVMPRRKHYIQYKVEETPDFSDLADEARSRGQSIDSPLLSSPLLGSMK